MVEMTRKEVSRGRRALNDEVRDIWNQNARFWDEKMGEGNEFHNLLIAPAQERLLALRPDELVLDVACGNGQFSRRMATLGARIVAFDISERLIERAQKRTSSNEERIQYRVMDATNRRQLMTLGKRRFDAAVCTMALMDIPEVDVLVSCLSKLLKSDGRFVFSVSHPCFNSSGTTLVAEQEDRDGELITTYSVKVSKYIRQLMSRGVAIAGQPIPQYYFDRPISAIFDACFKAGFVVDGLEEPVFGETAKAKSAIGWGNYREVPPVLVTRVRLLHPS